MDSSDKIIVAFLTAVLFLIGVVMICNNLRWRANMRSYQENGYTQKRVVSGYKTIWVIDPNHTKD